MNPIAAGELRRSPREWPAVSERRR